jgi:hypothetical protein
MKFVELNKVRKAPGSVSGPTPVIGSQCSPVLELVVFNLLTIKLWLLN